MHRRSKNLVLSRQLFATAVVALSCVGGIRAQSYGYTSVIHAGLTGDAAAAKFGWSMAASGDRIAFGSPHHANQFGRVSVVQGAAPEEPPVHLIDVYNQGGTNPIQERFGASIALSGDWLAVGNCSPFGSAQYCGSNANWVTLFHFDGASWQAYPRFASPSSAPGGDFGKAIALSGDLLVVGGGRTSSSAVGRDVVYLYRRIGSVWPTTPSDSLFGDGSSNGASEAFGHALYMDGNHLLVGATGDDELGADCGATYLYGRDHGGTGNWGLVRKLLPANGMVGDHFGTSVAIRDGRCIVGAPDRTVHGETVGAAYLFEEDAGFPGNWGEVAYLEPIGDLGADMSFGDAVALGPDRVAVGAPLHELNGNGYDGSVHVYGKEGATWNAVQQIVPQEEGLVSVASRSGNSLAFSGDRLLIGAPWAKLLGQTPEAVITGVVLVYAEGPVSVPSYERSNLHLFPNPCTDRVQLRSDAGALVRVRMVDGLGRVVRPWENAIGTSFAWLLDGVDPGAYFVQCEMAGGERITLPLVRQ